MSLIINQCYDDFTTIPFSMGMASLRLSPYPPNSFTYDDHPVDKHTDDNTDTEAHGWLIVVLKLLLHIVSYMQTTSFDKILLPYLCNYL
jgi:hypothetical protein